MAECTYCGEYEVVHEKAGHMVCDCCGVISQESVVAHDRAQ
jgi:transcription initiation factor TFIIIB Brf1 subunit/transcription initiation factor TFIIB